MGGHDLGKIIGKIRYQYFKNWDFQKKLTVTNAQFFLGYHIGFFFRNFFSKFWKKKNWKKKKLEKKNLIKGRLLNKRAYRVNLNSERNGS